MEKYTFVLAGDNAYTPYIETTIKSILYHHMNCKIYILNDDILQEWFIKMNTLAEPLHSKIIDVKLVDEHIEWESGVSHINKMGYARYFIPKYIKESKVLYVDSDIIINANLSHVFNFNLDNMYMAAVYDIHTLQFFGDLAEYNSGFLLINNDLWKSDKLHQILSETTESVLKAINNKSWERPFNGDQTIINIVCKERVLTLPLEYNYQIGMEKFALNEKWSNFTVIESPKVIHYVTEMKPWNSSRQFRLKEVWWDYNNLEVSDIVSVNYKTIPKIKNKVLKKCFTLTNSQDIEGIEYLAKSCPDCIFNIAAYSYFGSKAFKLQKYQNIRLYPNIFQYEIDNLIEDCDLYLNINHGGVVGDILDKVVGKGKKILSFTNTVFDCSKEIVFDIDYPEKMSEYILNL